MDKKTYYQQNRNRIIKNQCAYYRKMIDKMTKEELEEFRRKKREYYRDWYEKKKYRTHNPKKKNYQPPRKYKKRGRKAKKKEELAKDYEMETTEIVFNFSD